jgi:hypothetical protein
MREMIRNSRIFGMALSLSVAWATACQAAKPGPGPVLLQATFGASSLTADGQGPYVGDQQGVRCELNNGTGDFLFSPNLFGNRRWAQIDLGIPVPDPCGILPIGSGSAGGIQNIDYMNVDQVLFVTSATPVDRYVWMQFRDGTFGLSIPNASCQQLGKVQVEYLGPNSSGKRMWHISTPAATGERRQTVKGQTLPTGYFTVSIDITLTEQ